MRKASQSKNHSEKRALQRVAVIGPFDIENYGDHIFERILLWKIKKEFSLLQIDVFSISSGRHGFGEDMSSVYSIDDLEKMHAHSPYDALFIAGGSIIHLKTILQDVRGEIIAYPIWKLWVVASYVAAKYSIPLAWNNPEVPADFVGWEGLALPKLLSPVGYLSVRNVSSVSAIEQFTKRKILLGADCAFLLPNFVASNTLRVFLPSEISQAHERPFAIFHCNHRLDDISFEQTIKILDKLITKGYCVILLPLAYTNREQNILRKLHEKMGERTTFIPRTLTIGESIALFREASLYVGLSFHGAISTYSFGGEIVAYDYESRRKTKELYESLGKAENYATEIEHLEKIIDRITIFPIAKQTPEQLNSITASLEEHFTAMFSFVHRGACYEREDLSGLLEIISTEIAERDEYANQMRTLSDGYAECYRQYEELRTTMIEPSGFS